MAVPDLAVIAEGDLASGEHWILRAGGSSTEFSTFLETIHPDGRRDEGGMGGPPLWPGSIMNVYTGGTDTGSRRIVVRADPIVTLVRVQLADGGHLDLPPVATLPDPGLAFFATLLPRTAALAAITAIDASGQALEPQDLASHEQAWQRFQRRTGRSWPDQALRTRHASRQARPREDCLIPLGAQAAVLGGSKVPRSHERSGAQNWACTRLHMWLVPAEPADALPGGGHVSAPVGVFARGLPAS